MFVILRAAEDPLPASEVTNAHRPPRHHRPRYPPLPPRPPRAPPHLREATFLERIRAQQTEGYHLALLALDDGAVTTVAGFRTQEMLATGKTLYVDDLVTAPSARSLGHGKAMLHWLIDHARSTACNSFSLDSGTHRQDAHAFYLRERLRITSFHFHLPLTWKADT